MAELSIIIPTLNAGPVLGPTLGALAEMESVGLIKDLVVSDGGSEDGTQKAVVDAGAVLVEGLPGRGRQLRAGADAARGDWFLFIHADTVLAPGWSDGVRVLSSGPTQPNGRVLCALDDPSSSARRLERLVRWRNRLFGLPYGDQGLLISKRLYGRIGGYRDFSLMEDVDIVRRLGRESLGRSIFGPQPRRCDFSKMDTGCGLCEISLAWRSSTSVFRWTRSSGFTDEASSPHHIREAARLGRVKRRLAADIGTMEALRFYRRNLAATSRILGAIPDGNAGFSWTGGRSLARNLPRRLQARGDLGVRMETALRALPQGSIVLIGSDIPGVSKRYSPCLSWFGAVRRCFWAGGGRWLLACRTC